jgi:flavodoxin
MKTLIVYYSLTGKTKIIAESLAKNLNADLEEIHDQKDRSGLWQKIVAGYHACIKQSTTISPPKFNPTDYDLVIIGTPVWAATMSCAVRAWLAQYAAVLKKVAFFATMGGSGDVKTFKDMTELSKLTPVATATFTDKKIKANDFQAALEQFIAALK